MASHQDPRETKRENAGSEGKAQSAERKAEAEPPAPKPTITDWAAI